MIRKSVFDEAGKSSFRMIQKAGIIIKKEEIED